MSFLCYYSEIQIKGHMESDSVKFGELLLPSHIVKEERLILNLEFMQDVEETTRT